MVLAGPQSPDSKLHNIRPKPLHIPHLQQKCAAHDVRRYMREVCVVSGLRNGNLISPEAMKYLRLFKHEQ